ncbi:MAG: YSC84-related protein [Sedimentitalea sp.]|uniref:lipid-binding SYLF domain-containing protein n=1 Tax=Sedimentitalea sp. TaxID=2048915 RepID=UPI00326353DF
MLHQNRRKFLKFGIVASFALYAGAQGVAAENLAERAEIDMASDKVLQALLDSNTEAKTLSSTALAMLIFPKVTETGLAGIGGKRGKGVLREDGKSIAYYRTTSLSFGAQMGFETHGYVAMFMTQAALEDFTAKDDYEVTAQSEITVMDESSSAQTNITASNSSIVVFVFDEKGARLDLTVDGTKINRMDI